MGLFGEVNAMIPPFVLATYTIFQQIG